jgi:hypothetical protein
MADKFPDKPEELSVDAFTQPEEALTFTPEEANVRRPDLGLTGPLTMTTTRKEPTPTMQELTRKRGEVAEAQKTALRQLSDVSAQDAARQQQILAGTQQKQDELLQDELKIRDEFTNRIRTESESIATERQRLNAMKPTTFWQRSDTSDKILMGIALLAGGLGQGLSRSQTNAAVDAMNRAIDRDVQMQENLISRQMESLRQRTKDVALLEREEQKLLNSLNARKLAALDHTKNMLNQAALMTKNESAKQNLALQIADLDNAMIEAQAAVEEDLMTKIETSMIKQPDAAQQPAVSFEDVGVTDAGVPFNTEQGKAQGFLVGAAQAEDRLESLVPLDDSKRKFQEMFMNARTVPFVGGAFEFVFDFIGSSRAKGGIGDRLTPEDQEYLQAGEQWIQNVLRKESGNAIGADEFSRTWRTYFPMAGDSQKVIQAKAKARKDKIKSMKSSTGNTKQILPWERKTTASLANPPKGTGKGDDEEIIPPTMVTGIASTDAVPLPDFPEGDIGVEAPPTMVTGTA